MKTYIFDFDGTLVDSMPTWSRVMKRLLDETNTPYGEDIIKIITPLGNLGVAKYYRSIGCPLTDEEFLEKKDAYLTCEYRDNIPAKETCIETLIKMKERGDSINVLTASAHSNLDPCLKRLGIFDMFDNVWSCDDFNTTKTDPNIYRLAAKRLGKTVDEVIFVDDNLDADKTAKAAGMTVYGIYDESSKDYVEDMKAVTDGYAYLFSDLLTL
ncbi:MAG: HAD family phosphatase [Clostridia bacterium]|nr:HAD family phosphatase [Clostridia bacterium]